MASGKQSKRARREAAQAPVGRAAGSRKASPKVLIGALAVVVAVGIAVGVGLALTGGSSTSSTTVPERGSLQGALPGAARVESLFHGIPQAHNVLGSPDAPVTVIEYVDLQCPYCRTFEADALPDLVSRYVRTGKAKIERRLLAFVGPDSERGRLASIAAGQQGRQFNLTALLYANQGAENTGWLDDELVTAAAASIPGLAVPKLLASAESDATAEEAAEFDRIAGEENVRSTPTILVGKTGGTPQLVELSDPGDSQAVASAIESALG